MDEFRVAIPLAPVRAAPSYYFAAARRLSRVYPCRCFAVLWDARGQVYLFTHSLDISE